MTRPAIPTDIQKAAAAIYALLGRGPDADERTIAEALNAERERCAEIAACDCCDVCGESPGYPKCANEIAAAIRNPTPGA